MSHILETIFPVLKHTMCSWSLQHEKVTIDARFDPKKKTCPPWAVDVLWLNFSISKTRVFNVRTKKTSYIRMLFGMPWWVFQRQIPTDALRLYVFVLFSVFRHQFNVNNRKYLRVRIFFFRWSILFKWGEFKKEFLWVSVDVR